MVLGQGRSWTVLGPKSVPRASQSTSRATQEHPRAPQECCQSTPRASQERTKRLPDHLKSRQREFWHVLVMVWDHMRFMLIFDTMSGNMLRMICWNSEDDARGSCSALSGGCCGGRVLNIMSRIAIRMSVWIIWHMFLKEYYDYDCDDD